MNLIQSKSFGTINKMSSVLGGLVTPRRPILLLSILVTIITPATVVPNPINSTTAAAPAARGETNYKVNRFTLTASGSCQAGKVYKITALSNFQKYLNELECLFFAAEPPDFIPEGIVYGDVLKVINSRLFSSIAAPLWKGKIIRKIRCDNSSSQETHYGWNHVIRRPVAPFIATIGNVSSLNLLDGEFDDGKASMVLSSAQDLTEICPEYREMMRQKYGDIEIRRTNVHFALIPVINMFDVVRFVGKQADGANIFLAKSYFKDLFTTNKGMRTVAYFHLVSYDNRVMANAKHGDSLLPLERSFSYKLSGLADISFEALFPLQRFIITPATTIREMIRAFAKLANKSMSYLNEVAFGLSSVRQARRDFLEDFGE